MKKSIFICLAFILFSFAIKAQNDDPPPPPPFPPSGIEMTKAPTIKEFLEANKSVADVRWKNRNEIVVKLKNGKEEKYDVRDEAQKKKFISKYQFLPAPPPRRVTS